MRSPEGEPRHTARMSERRRPRVIVLPPWLRWLRPILRLRYGRRVAIHGGPYLEVHFDT
jgi:hypothetical protein